MSINLRAPFALFVLACTLTVSKGVAQELVYKSVNWESSPKLHTLGDKEKEKNYVVLKDKLINEYVYEASGQLVMYETRHVIIHINNDKGIEAKNKVYIPNRRILEEIELKARTITSEGKVIMLSKDAVKKVDNLENLGPFIIFALEGVDKGSEVEYLYTNKKTSSLYGSWNMQGDELKKNVEVHTYSPSNLVFEARGYNGFAEFKKDTALKDKNHIFATMTEIKDLEDEVYSMAEANKMRFMYQLTYNTTRSKARMYTWDYSATEYHRALFILSKGETKALEKLAGKLGLAKLADDEAKIRALERYVKLNIENKEEETENVTVDKALEMKYCGELNLQKIYLGAAQVLNIPVELVLTTDRSKKRFDPDFQTWNNFDEYLLYFPTTGKYLSASNYLSRLGYPPAELTYNKGLFIKETTLGEIRTAISKVKTIDAMDYKQSYNNINASIVFDNNFLPTATVSHVFNGYPAFYTQPLFLYLNAEQKKETLDDIVKMTGKETVVKSTDTKGTGELDILINPLVISSVIEVPHLVQNAGNKYLFKIGEMIGPQQELYQEKAREGDGEISYTHSFTRVLQVKIPDNYKVANLEALNIQKKCESSGAVMASFRSDYTLDNNMLKITVYEEYRALVYPKAVYEDFRKVINAAADFNKVTLIFEKK